MARLRLPFALYALVLATGVALAALLAAGARAGEHGAIARVDSIGVTVSDMDRALAFYTGVLPFQAVAETEVDGRSLRAPVRRVRAARPDRRGCVWVPRRSS